MSWNSRSTSIRASLIAAIIRSERPIIRVVAEQIDVVLQFPDGGHHLLVRIGGTRGARKIRQDSAATAVFRLQIIDDDVQSGDGRRVSV